MVDVNLSPYTAEQQAMDRRRKMAEAMQQQAVAPIEMPTVPGAKVSHLQGLAKLLQGYIAGKNLDRADQEQKDYENQVSGETANLLSNMGQYQTVPGDIIKPGQKARYEAPVPIEENLQQKQAFMDLYSPKPENKAAAAIGYKMLRPEDIARIKNLPSQTEGKEIAAVPEERGPSQQVPVLNASFLNTYKTGQVKQMLLQYLMQQEAQKQAAAQRALEAQQAIHVGKPGETFFRIGADNKPITVANTPAIPSFEKVETRDPVTGLTIHKYVNKTELGNLGNVPAPYSGFVKDITEAQNAPESIKNNPALLNVLGSNLNKTGGLPTEKDVVNTQLAEAQARAQLAYQGINLGKTEQLVKAKNPLIQSKPLPPAGTQLEIGVVYDTPKGRVRWNGTSFTTVD